METRLQGKSREGRETVDRQLFNCPQKRMMFLRMTVVEGEIWFQSGFILKVDIAELADVTLCIHRHIFMIATPPPFTQVITCCAYFLHLVFSPHNIRLLHLGLNQ